MIRSFRDRWTEQIFTGKSVAKFPSGVQRVAQRKLQQLDIATTLRDLMVPPGNRLEPLKGSRRGQHSIRINDQYRVYFRWSEEGPQEVEITDYH
jgi:proteic killer suppression protein